MIREKHIVDLARDAFAENAKTWECVMDWYDGFLSDQELFNRLTYLKSIAPTQVWDRIERSRSENTEE